MDEDDNELTTDNEVTDNPTEQNTTVNENEQESNVTKSQIKKNIATTAEPMNELPVVKNIVTDNPTKQNTTANELDEKHNVRSGLIKRKKGRIGHSVGKIAGKGLLTKYRIAKEAAILAKQVLKKALPPQILDKIEKTYNKVNELHDKLIHDKLHIPKLH